MHMPDPTVRQPTTTLAHGVDHYENFPVASLLCPPALRPAVVAIYHFARTADDLADEGHASSDERLEQLATYREDLNHALLDRESSHQWRHVFQPLARAAALHRLPGNLLHDLISAFEQDVNYTARGHRYQSTNELLDYCKLSANPVGRLLLHLYGIQTADALEQSDHICSALQLINFWQDISVDLPRGRCYLPADALRRQDVAVGDFASDNGAKEAAMQAVVAELCADARERMQQGAPLVHRVPGRAGWELRLVVQGGLRILDGIAARHHRSWQTRVTLRKGDLPRLAWRALWM
jgi:hydroxysqualene synthase